MNPDTVAKMRAMIAFIKEYQVEFGTSPSYMEIAKVVGYKSSNGVMRLIACAEKRKLLRKPYGKTREIEVLA